MKQRFALFRRGSKFYSVDTTNGKQVSRQRSRRAYAYEAALRGGEVGRGWLMA